MAFDYELIRDKANKLRHEQLELQEERSVFTEKLADKRLEMSLLNSKIKRMGGPYSPEAKELGIVQDACKKDMRRLEKIAINHNHDMKNLNLKIKELEDILYSRREKESPVVSGNEKSKWLIEQLVSMRDRYVKFSSDSTRVSSTRIMASSFAAEIGIILDGQEIE